MYHPVEVAHLSESQISKLLKGQPIRVKSGKGHVLHLSSEQLKKHHKSAVKGSGHNLTLDPYQVGLHTHLKGRGIMSAAKKHLKHAGQFVKANKEHFRPLARELKSMGHQAIGQAHNYALEQGVNPELASYYSNLASQNVEHPQQRGGSLKSFSKFMNKPAVRDIRKALKPIGQAAFNTAEDMALQGIQMAPMMLSTGMGLKRKPRKHNRGGALMPAGY